MKSKVYGRLTSNGGVKRILLYYRIIILTKNPPRTSHPPVKADTVASHLLQVARAPVNKKHKRRVQVEWRYFLRHAPDKSLPTAFTVDEIYQTLQNMKAGIAPGYDPCSPGVLEELGS